MTTPIYKSILKNTSVVGRIPQPSEISKGELVLNDMDGRLFYKDANGVVQYFVSDTSSISDFLVGSFTWDSATPSPDAAFFQFPNQFIKTNLYDRIRGCVLNDDTTVNYYLHPNEKTKKIDGTDADLSGADGNVMIEIPKFYYKTERVGTFTTWKISPIPLSGFRVHPAFIKANVEVDYRYYGAYDACVKDVSSSPEVYISGLNLDDMTSNIDTNADELASVSGVYPIVGVTRDECRKMAENAGTGFHQLDVSLVWAVQLLYLVEYQTFFSQAVLGAGNTEGSYVNSSSNQSDSPHTISGASNALGAESTNETTGAGADAKPGTSFMSYRGIENFYGNCWNWVDGANINVGSAGNLYWTNDYENFADDTSTGHELILSDYSTGSDYQRDLSDAIDYGFVPSSVSGASSTTYITDRSYGSSSSNRVLRFGGGASVGAGAGAFSWSSDPASSASDRLIGSRLAA